MESTGAQIDWCDRLRNYESNTWWLVRDRENVRSQFGRRFPSFAVASGAMGGSRDRNVNLHRG
ncbi:uncharacterized protein PHALS_04620 [Plasmopara halstedii]|uniref:Uncharacterized protein n=1 Tax=Plasmopara halstedii TaxID=4781 RepID=A0A0P1A9U6_PLAHL|nr:uncharacterized protein PHALS_04620 [Plasmopara halstedii]CEG37172.1 hypothetical protein PHALS_04620 [Plasmopara halstedii]|eukprot:XP_024573541.1 hypothetical protein PHALS_04620 [Plasmopara halstedii]